MIVEEKIKALKFTVNGGPRTIRLDDEDVKKIVGVFEEEGWLTPEQSNQVQNLANMLAQHNQELLKGKKK